MAILISTKLKQHTGLEMENIERYGVASVILLLILKELVSLYKSRLKKADNTEDKLIKIVTENMFSEI